MILVTVGGSSFKFDRLFKILDELCDDKIIDADELVVQTGKIDYKIRNYVHFEFVDALKMKEYQKNADLIICHSGTGTVINCLKNNKKIIIFPRLSKFGEHTDDHQLELCETFYSNGYVLKALDKNDLVEAINHSKTFNPKEFVSNSNEFLNLILKLIEE